IGIGEPLRLPDLVEGEKRAGIADRLQVSDVHRATIEVPDDDTVRRYAPLTKRLQQFERHGTVFRMGRDRGAGRDMSDRGSLDGGSLDLRDVVQAGTNLDHTRAGLRVLDPVPKLTDEFLRQNVDICGARQPGCMKVLMASGNSEQMDRNPARDVDQSLDVSTVIAGGTLDQRATVHRDERLDLVLGPRLVIETIIRIVFRNRNRVAQEMDMV